MIFGLKVCLVNLACFVPIVPAFVLLDMSYESTGLEEDFVASAAWETLVACMVLSDISVAVS